jgi:hypothetical protein
MKTLVRNSVAVIVGLVVGSLVNMGLVLAGSHLVPAPVGVDMNDAKSLAAGVHLLGPKHFLFPFLAHALGTLAGALATYLSAATRRAALAYLIAAFFLAGGIAAAFMIPAPAWFIACDLLIAYFPMAWLATRIGRGIRG